jgi:uncharacterized OsmC-like protein
MPHDTIAAAVQRVKSVLQRRPSTGLHDDTSALARWQGGLRMETAHPGGATIVTDMPVELGGTGDRLTPGWMFRAGLASCTAVTILLHAADAGVTITHLEVKALGKSDSRGLLDVPQASGEPVYAGPSELALHVRIGASDAPPQKLREIVTLAARCSPVAAAVQRGLPLAVEIEVLVS